MATELHLQHSLLWPEMSLTPVLSTEDHCDGTLFDVLIKKTISIREQVDEHDVNSNECQTPNSKYTLRHILLKELSLFLSWYIGHDQTRDNRNRTPPTSTVPFPLIHAAQVPFITLYRNQLNMLLLQFRIESLSIEIKKTFHDRSLNYMLAINCEDSLLILDFPCYAGWRCSYC